MAETAAIWVTCYGLALLATIGISPKSIRVHMAAACDPTVQHLVSGMLHDRTSLWRESQPDQLAGLGYRELK